MPKSKGRRKPRKPQTAQKRVINKAQPIALRTLPVFAHFDNSEYWYGLLPELIMIQGKWIQENAKKLKLAPELDTYLSNAVSLHHTALIVTGNDR